VGPTGEPRPDMDDGGGGRNELQWRREVANAIERKKFQRVVDYYSITDAIAFIGGPVSSSLNKCEENGAAS